MELSKPKKFEIGFVQGNKIINDGLVTLGMNATDILGFAKPANERRIRKVRGAQAWFKNMYKNGWKYAGSFEQEGLLNNGFVVMERELPNKVLDAIREELQILLREDVLIVTPDAPMSFIPKIVEINPDKLQTVTFEKPGDLRKAILKAREPIEGFESDVNDFMIDAKKEMKTLEESFFEETGKKAIWRGKETIAFKSWKKELEL